MTRSDLTNELMSQFMLMKRRLYRGMSQLSEHSFTPVQMQILFLISTGIGRTADIAKELNISGSAVTQHVTNMAAQGWVLRSEGKDRREVLLSLAPDMSRMISERKEQAHSEMTVLTSALTRPELEQLVTLLQKINQRD